MTAPRRPRGPDRPGKPTHAAAASNPEASVRGIPTGELVSELARKATELARKEIELARAEVRADLRAELRAASGLGVAGLCGILTLQLLLTAVVLALMQAGILPGWAAALIVGAVVLAIGTAVGLWSWARRVRTPLVTTRRSLQEDVRWAKAQIA